MNAPRTTRLLISLLALALLPAASAARQKDEPLSLITVTGQAEMRVPPDEAVFNLEVSRLDKDIGTAQRQVDDSVRQILALARRYNVPQEDVKTHYIKVGIRYTTDLIDDEDAPAANVKKVKREFLGYEVSKSVAVRLKDLTRFEQFFAEVLATGVSKVDEVELRSSQLRKYKDQARAAAMRAAREKAVAMATEIGQTVGRAYSIQEEGYSRISSNSNYTGYVSGDLSTEENSSFAPGTISVTAQVTVKFLLN
jgi:uncharacterized protein YggE